MVDQVSPMSLKGCVYVLMVELALDGSATNGATPSSYCTFDHIFLPTSKSTWYCTVCLHTHCTFENNKDHQENDGTSDVYDRLEFMIVSNCSYPNCCRTNCCNFVNLSNFLFIKNYRYIAKDDSCVLFNRPGVAGAVL